MATEPVLFVFRRDLRLRDNPGFRAACRAGAVVPVYVWETRACGANDGDAAFLGADAGSSGDSRRPLWPMGEAQRWWLHHSLHALNAGLEEVGLRLTLRSGDAATEVRRVAREVGASQVFWSHRYDPPGSNADEQLSTQLKDSGLRTRAYGGTLLHDPAGLTTQSGTPYSVFTPFYRRFKDVVDVGSVIGIPESIEAPETWPRSVALEEFGLLPTRDWAKCFPETGTPGEAGALARLDEFLDDAVYGYADGRDLMGKDGTSRLSPHLAMGEISPRQVWNAVTREAETSQDGEKKVEPYLRQIVWREFAYHVLSNNPSTDHKPLRDKYAAFPWSDNDEHLRAWQRGRTGYPIVDAAMRQLWATGWMHNRARMIVASFLTKHLRLHWLHGAQWFWDTLVDADLANNSLGWQWSAGSGADAQPYFRIFNPMTQGKKFDGDGSYVRQWVPELTDLPDRYIHAPWEADEDVLKKAGVSLGGTYPRPIVDHGEAREAALAAYDVVKESAG